jgi:hypothetical protein
VELLELEELLELLVSEVELEVRLAAVELELVLERELELEEDCELLELLEGEELLAELKEELLLVTPAAVEEEDWELPELWVELEELCEVRLAEEELLELLELPLEDELFPAPVELELVTLAAVELELRELAVLELLDDREELLRLEEEELLDELEEELSLSPSRSLSSASVRMPS